MNNQSTDTMYLEQKILEGFEIQEHIKSLQERLEQVKESLLSDMKLSVVNEVLVNLNADYDIKAKLADRTSRKLNKEELAEDLDVAVSSIDTKFLLKSVEDGRLSLKRYLDYLFSETNEGVSIRRVKATGKRVKNESN